jgi:hypothetical protein
MAVTIVGSCAEITDYYQHVLPFKYQSEILNRNLTVLATFEPMTEDSTSTVISEFPELDRNIYSTSWDTPTPKSSLGPEPACSLPLSTSTRPHKRPKISKRSFIWQHASNPDNSALINSSDNLDPTWCCRHCRQTYQVRSGTTKAREHLQKVHHISEKTTEEKRLQRTHNTIQTAIARAIEIQQEHKQQIIKNALNPEVLEQLYVQWITAHGVPFNQVRWPKFRAFLEYISPEANCLLPHSPTTVSSWVTRIYTQEKEHIKQGLQSALSSIHFTVDMWTSPNFLSMFGVIAHYTDENGQLSHAVLAIKEIDGEHSGENMAHSLMEVLDDYQIKSKIGYFMTDNACQNDTMLQIISDKLAIEDIEYDANLHRLRCNGHIINLAAQAFLFDIHPDALELCNNDLVEAGNAVTEEELNKWRKMGPLGRLHNLIIYIRRSPQRLQAFRKHSNGCGLKRDNETRWNSWYNMLEWVLREDIQRALETFCLQHKDVANDRLSYDDWDNLKNICQFLQAFYDATKATEGRLVTVDSILPTMDFLLEHFENGIKTYANDKYMLPCIKSGWAKLDEYYSKTDRTPVYIAAIVLCPRWKWEYFQQLWPIDWVNEARQKMKIFWETHYKSTSFIVPGSHSKSIFESTVNQFEAWMKQRQTFIMDVDEYERYIAQPVLPDITDARTWWMEGWQRKIYPNLSMMAIDLLSIPAMSAEPERLFSGAKITITDRRNRLSGESINATECLKSWSREMDACINEED